MSTQTLMARTVMSAAQFAFEGKLLLRQVKYGSRQTFQRRFRSFFGASPVVCSRIWCLLQPSLPPSSSLKHLLWSLLFLKLYDSEHVNQVISGADEKTFRKWAWTFVKLLSCLRVIKWNDRRIARLNRIYLASVDRVDFVIQEQTPFSPIWYSHKFHGPGVRYEIGIGIGTGNICWAHGPFPCGRYSDLNIFKQGMKQMLDNQERVVADAGYKDEKCSFGSPEYDHMDHGYIRARREAFNKRMKQFQVLGRRFRHSLTKHADCFYAVANITYLLVENGESVFL